MLVQVAIFLAAAVAAVLIFKRLGLGAVLGYLAAGALIGPSGLGLASDVDETLHTAELGVVLLLFVLGLELEPARLWKMRTKVFGYGGAQVLVTTVLLTAIGAALGLSFHAALVSGLALSLSSTAFALQLLGERNELATPHGRLGFAILLFQDVAAIPALALVPLLAGRPDETAHDGRNPLVSVAIALAVLVGLVVVGRLVLRPLLRVIANARSHELSSATALLVVIATGIVVQQAGLSMALGAFMAGVLLADSEFRHELEANIEPFKGLLLGLFFMAVGMGANLRLIIERPLIVVALVLGLVVVKTAVLVAVAKLRRLSTEAALSLGIALSQGGEFAFVIFGAALGAGAISRELNELMVVVVTLSMVTTPLFFVAFDRIRKALDKGGPTREFDTIDEEQNRVIIAGFGRYGQIVARVLRGKGIRYTCLEANASFVDVARRYGNRIYYGDASRVDLLRAAHAEDAALFVLAIDDVEASVRTARVVTEHFPHLKIVARARNRDHVHDLMALGITTIHRETFYSALQTARHALIELGLPTAEARRAVRTFRERDQAALVEQFDMRDNEEAVIESTKKVAAELERLLAEDARSQRTR